MKKLTVYCSLLLAFGVLFFAADARAQTRKPDLDGLNKPVIVPTDKNFDAQKQAPSQAARRGIAYEAWITTDGVLHCKTSSPLKSAAIKFTAPTVSSTNANDTTTGSGGDVSRKFELKKSPDGAYVFDISADKYKEKHAVTLTITSTFGTSAEIKLINKKIPAKIEN